MKKQTMSYEQGVERAQALIDALEKGSMSLEDSFAAYEEAAKIIKQLEKMLESNEKRIALLLADGEMDITHEVEP